MDYLKLTINVADPAFTEVLEAELVYAGFDSFDSADGQLVAYAPIGTADEAAIENVLTEYASEITATGRENIAHQNWNAQWESAYQPVFIDKQLMIRAPFHSVDEAVEECITIVPNMSFGTGHHATTEQVLRQMITMDLTGKHFFDFGCGSGVLSIYAAKKGAHGIGVEIDPHAAEAARENLTANGTQHFEIKTGGIEQVLGQRFDLIAANINRNVIEESLPALTAMMNANASLICSGFLESDITALSEITRKNGLEIHHQTSKNGWGIICAKKPL